ncbi:MAG: DUF2520 domain-containing protein [Planctomycetota bacterium]|nr:DUF2520 domain-containing protein [Planctomycetota bacterium]
MSHLKMTPPSVHRGPLGIVGAGALAHAVAASWAQRAVGGEGCVQVWARTLGAGKALHDSVQASIGEPTGVGAVCLLGSIADMASVRTVVLAVKDKDLPQAAEELAQHPAQRKDQVVLHASGALGVDVLAPLEAAGYAVGRWHPLVSLRVKADVRAFRGVGFSLAGDDPAVERATRLAEYMGGWVLPSVVETGKYVEYHAAASLMAGGLSVLFEPALAAMTQALGDRDAARRGLIQLLRSVATHLSGVEPREALTGPSSRGDVDVVRAHLQALPEAGADLYRAFLPAMLDMAQKRGTLSAEDRERMENLLDEGSNG